MTPQRIQLRRQKGWRKPEGAVVVARPSIYGNPYKLDRVGDMRRRAGWYVHTPSGWCGSYGDYPTKREAAQRAVDLYRQTLTDRRAGDRLVKCLAGHDLACWCPILDVDGNRWPCHADVLLEIANPGWRP